MRNSAIVLASLILLSACGTADESGDRPPDEVRPLAQRLLEGRTLTAAPRDSTMLVTGHYLDGYGVPRTAAITLQAASVDVGVTPQGTFGLNAVRLELGDVITYPGNVPLHLTDLEVRLAEPVRMHTQWNDDGTQLNAVGDVTLLLDWALAVDGVPYRLGQQRLAAVPLEITVSAVGQERVALHLEATQPGVFWNWGGMIELSDLQLVLEASDSVPVVD